MSETARTFAAVAAGLLVLNGGCSIDRPAEAVSSGSRAPIPSRPPVGRIEEATATMTPPITPSDASRAISDSFAAAAQAIRPSVVRLDVEKAASEFGTGSGVIVDAAGDILTNRHVVSGMDKVTIRMADHRAFPGRLVGEDPLTDVAVVRFETPPTRLVAARLGDSGALRTGQWVIAVGSPLGIDQTVTAGIVSGVGATGSGFRFESGERVRKYIETDAEINPGNSGGPLVNLSAQVVGINTLIDVGPGGSYGFAIPINQAYQVAQLLIADGRVRYPYIGVSAISTEDLPVELRQQLSDALPRTGAVLVEVEPGGPAAKAGLRQGDVVTRLGNRPIATGADLVGAISDARIGERVRIDLLRHGHARSVESVIGEYPFQR